MMRWVLVGVLAIPLLANAKEMNCGKVCAMVVKRCEEGCKKSVDPGDKVRLKACLGGCKDMEKQCAKQCEKKNAKNKEKHSH